MVLFLPNHRRYYNLSYTTSNHIVRFCGLKINTAKTKAMVFEMGRHTHLNFYLNNAKLEIVTSFKYISIHFLKKWKLAQDTKRLLQHAAFALHNLFFLFRQIEFTTSQKCTLVDVLVGSILNYSAEVSGNNEVITRIITIYLIRHRIISYALGVKDKHSKGEGHGIRER